MQKSLKTPEKVKRGGKRPGSGRKPGTPNKNPKPLKLLAEQYTEEAIKTLVDV